MELATLLALGVVVLIALTSWGSIVRFSGATIAIVFVLILLGVTSMTSIIQVIQAIPFQDIEAFARSAFERLENMFQAILDSSSTSAPV